MKRYFTLLFLALFGTTFLSAQTTTRVLLVEEATNTGCGPCASQNPAFDALLRANESKVAVIKYHSDWPSAQDPFWMANWSENNYRVGYYDVTGVPTSMLNGSYINGGSYSGAPANLTQSMIDNAVANGSTVEFQVNQTSLGGDDVQVDVRVQGLQTTGGADNRLHVVLVEDQKTFLSAPGSNGETEFNWTMLKMVTGRFGHTIGTVGAGSDTTYSYQYTIDPSWDPTELRVVVFLQRHALKDVYQAYMSPTNAVGVEEELNTDLPVLGNSYPNPAGEVSYLQLSNIDQEMELRIVDLQGRVLKTEIVRPGATVLEVNTSELADGMYVYQLVADGATLATRRMMVAK